MARAIASGTIAFGLVSIPVKLFPSVSPSDGIHFHNLHRECGNRLKYQYYCPTHDKHVTRDEMIKGYEFAKGQFVTFTADELDAVEEQTSGGIDIVEFVPIAEVDPIYYDKAYYIAPDEGAGRAYHLLAAALRTTKLCALARYAARGKQYLVLVRPVKLGLVLQQLHYPEELRAMGDVDIETSDVKDGELDLAIKLIEQGAKRSFAVGQYRDEVRDRIRALIDRKVAGEDIMQAAATSPKAQVIDLMAALKQSLGVSEGMSAENSSTGGDPTTPPSPAADGGG